MAIAEMTRSTTADAIPDSTITRMKALVYHGPGKRDWEQKPRPVIEKPTDAVVRITTTTICGTDLHILKGDLPAVTDGRILGHEGIGTIEQVGQAVSEFEVGDKVIISCVTACLKCDCVGSSTPLRARRHSDARRIERQGSGQRNPLRRDGRSHLKDSTKERTLL
jgi:NADPH:quinone reductase-like Zn-dependent oxidoreductase